MKFLLEAAGNNTMSIVLPVVLLVLVIGIFILNYFKSKKQRENMKNVVESLKVGDNVKTYSGFYGTIVEITETTDGKVAVLKTGNDKHVGYISIDMNAIYAIDQKVPVVLDENGNIILPEAKPVEAQVEAKPEVKEEKTPAKEPAKKTAAKKAPAKNEEVKAEEAPKTRKKKAE